MLYHVLNLTVQSDLIQLLSAWLISSKIARHRKTCTHSLCGEQERREIEAALHDGDLWAVAATNALELGVDVGSLDVTLHLGFPGTV